jgi:prolyl 4-hydroxylase
VYNLAVAMGDLRRSKRTRIGPRIPIRIQSLFMNEKSEPVLAKGMEMLCDSPRLYVVRNFVSNKEIEHFDMICTQYDKKFSSSFTEDENNQEVLSEFRTSNFIHLTKGQDSVIRRIETRAAELVGMSNQMVEPLQIVRYRDGQYFDVHHDAGTLLDDGSVELVAPRRFATVFLYLNSLPKGEGCTSFPKASLNVQPERGSAVVWCNLNQDGEPDPRTIHKACPVSDGFTKYGVNIWISEQSHQSLALVKSKTLLKKSVADNKVSVLTKAQIENEMANKNSKVKVKKEQILRV